jgi:nitrite reductase (NADH) small subunit
MAQEINLGPASAIPAGEGREFVVEGIRIAVFRPRSGGIYATQAECPHRRGPLADGLVGGTTVVCPLHAWKFDLTNGLPIMGEAGIAVYPARVSETGMIHVALPETFWEGDGEEIACKGCSPPLCSVSS